MQWARDGPRVSALRSAIRRETRAQKKSDCIFESERHFSIAETRPFAESKTSDESKLSLHSTLSPVEADRK